MSDRKIWVGCLASYNAGDLHGEWIDVDGDLESLSEAVQAILKSSPSPNAEEWHICDHEGFGGIEITRYESLERICGLAELLESHPVACVKYAFGCGYMDLAEIPGFLETVHMGHYESKQAYAETHLGVQARINPLYHKFMPWDTTSRSWNEHWNSSAPK